jgi:hypothetical protein
MSKAAELAALIGSQTALSNRNLIINGAMQVAQRGTSQTGVTANGYYTLDRWRLSASGATFNTSQQEFTLGQTSVPSQFKYYQRFEVTTGADFAGIATRIEDVTVVSGTSITVSFYAKGTNPGGGSMRLNIRQHFGSGGSTVVDTDDTFVLTSSWQRFEKTISLPSIGGKTIGSGSYLQCKFDQGSDTSTDAWTLDITGVQLEVGEQATPFEHRSFGDTLLQCQRFFYKVDHAVDGNYARVGHGTRVNQGTARCILALPVKMRATPTLSMVGTPRVEGSGASDISVIAGQTNKGPFAMGVDFTTANNGQPADGAVVVDLGASGEFSMDAEL